MFEEKDVFETFVNDPQDSEGVALMTEAPAATVPSAATARLRGFDLEEHPVLVDVPGLRGEAIRARATVPLDATHVDAAVVVLFEDGDVRRPIVVGVLTRQRPPAAEVGVAKVVTVQADEERLVLSAEREIVLRCGGASITLTRAGKVLIKGAYVLSRSSGYNRIKGAAVDIN